MSKRVAVIDLGSNAIRMSIFERTSRLGFFVLAEHKIKVRLAQGAYENNGILQDSSIQKCLEAFGEFKKLIKKYKANRVLCIGTSALRDAPNSKEFIKLVDKTYGIKIRCASGDDEARLGAISTINLLKSFEKVTTIDIGGGSTELACIENGKIINAISLNLGTVRLKELFSDKFEFEKMREYIKDGIKSLPDEFKCENIVAIGGSLRAISNSIMSVSHYPLKIVHNFSYDYETHKKIIDSIANAKDGDLEKVFVKKDRFDTIKEGANIFKILAEFLGAKTIITNGTGVREGIFLKSILRNNAKFPLNFNPSLKSLQDRFLIYKTSKVSKFAKDIFDALKDLHKLDDSYKNILNDAGKLCNIGKSLGYYDSHKHAAYLILNGLNYGYTHEERVLISCLIALKGKKDINLEIDSYKNLLPNQSSIFWLSFILELARVLDLSCDCVLKFEFDDLVLKISGNFIKNEFLIANIKKIYKPEDNFVISLEAR